MTTKVGFFFPLHMFLTVNYAVLYLLLSSSTAYFGKETFTLLKIVMQILCNLI